MVTTLDPSAGEDAHQLPRWIAADWFVYTARTGGGRRLIAQRMGGTERRVLVEDATDGRLVAKGRYLVFMRGATPGVHLLSAHETAWTAHPSFRIAELFQRTLVGCRTGAPGAVIDSTAMRPELLDPQGRRRSGAPDCCGPAP